METVLREKRTARLRRVVGSLWFWIGVSLALRLGMAFYLGNSLDELRGGIFDQISYDALARRVLAGYGFSFGRDWWPMTAANAPTAHWSFLYTLYLAAVYGVFGPFPLAARLIQAVTAGIAMPWLTYRIGRRCFGEKVGVTAAGISAIYIYLFYYAAALMTETFFIIALLWLLDVTMRLLPPSGAADPQPGRGDWLRLGLAWGTAMAAAVLLRQVILPFLLLLLLYALWWARRQWQIRRLMAALAVAGFVLLLAVAPWTLRNERVFAAFVPLNTNAGYAFFWSNHPIHGTHYISLLTDAGISYQSLIPPELRNLNEAALDQALLRRGLQFVWDDPGRIFLLSLSRIPVYFLFWPTADSSLLSNLSRVFSFGLFLPFMAWGVARAVGDLARRQARDAAAVGLLLLFITSYTLLHLASWSSVRYRLPVDACLIPFAAYALARAAHLARRVLPARSW